MAAGTPQPASQVVEAPPFRRVMPWVLVTLGVAVFIFFAAERTSVSTSEKTTVSEAAKPGDKPTTKSETVKENSLSDSTLTTLLGAAAVLVLTGAFYGRVRKITVAGQAVELDGDTKAVAEAVADSAYEKLTKDRDLTVGALSEADVREVLFDVAAAAAGLRQDVAALRAAGAVVPTRRTLDVVGEELPAPGVPLAPGLLKRLSDRATQEVADRRAREEGDDDGQSSTTERGR